jgi:peptidoglycan/LPS O-acetylase OafA/YrhL
MFILRFIGAVIVVVHHYGTTVLDETGFWKGFFDNGGFVLSFFFVLSAYVIGYHYFGNDRFNTADFLARRFSRLLPVYFIAFVATLVTGMILRQAYPKVISIIAQILCLHAWIPSIALDINFPSWSISVEVLFVLVFPIMVFKMKDIKLSRLILITVLFWAASVVQHLLFEEYVLDDSKIWTRNLVLFFPLWHFNAFLMGIAGAEIYKHISTRKFPIWLPPLIGVLSVVILVLISGTENPIRRHIHNGLMSPIIVVMLLAFSLDRSIVGRVMAAKPMIFLGNLTFAIYIFQYPVYMWTEAAIFPNGPQGYDFYVYLFILPVFSAIVYKVNEVPARKWLMKKAKNRVRAS